MGRKKIYLTEQEKHESRKKRQLGYYYRNREKINEKRMQKYYISVQKDL